MRTAIVQSWASNVVANNGFGLSLSDESFPPGNGTSQTLFSLAEINSREAAVVNQRPQLVVEFN